MQTELAGGHGATGLRTGSPAPEAWQSLFRSAPEVGGIEVRRQVVRRGGRTFLVLPLTPLLAAKGLDLYPAQTFKARTLKTGLKIALLVGLRPRIAPLQLLVDPQCPFSSYLAEQVRQVDAARGLQVRRLSNGQDLACWAMLAGNAASVGQRCIFLLFDETKRPCAVVKAGVGNEAIRLVRHEAGFLASVPPGTPALPALRSRFDTEGSAGFAMDFLPGRSPSGTSSEEIETLLTSWIRHQLTVKLESLAAWRTVTSAARRESSPTWLQAAEQPVHPVIFHGDFAPWNIRVVGNDWTVLDWERGDLMGVPGWDWLHYVIQKAVLVEKLAVPKLVAKIHSLLTSAGFQRYSQKAGIGGFVWTLTEAYLDHMLHIVRPSEGLEQIRGLAAAWKCLPQNQSHIS